MMTGNGRGLQDPAVSFRENLLVRICAVLHSAIRRIEERGVFSNWSFLIFETNY